MRIHKPILSSLALVERVFNSPKGYDLERFLHGLEYESLPSSVVIGEVLSAWLDVHKAISYSVRLVDPQQEVLFSVDLEIPEEGLTDTGVALGTHPVFFWIYKEGVHYLELVMDDQLINRSPLPVVKDTKKEIKSLAPEPELTAFLIGNTIISEEYIKISGFLTPGGLTEKTPIAYLLAWSSVIEAFDAVMEIYDTQDQLIHQEKHKISSDGSYPMYGSILVQNLPLILQSGKNLMILRWKNKEIRYPILVL